LLNPLSARIKKIAEEKDGDDLMDLSDVRLPSPEKKGARGGNDSDFYHETVRADTQSDEVTDNIGNENISASVSDNKLTRNTVTSKPRTFGIQIEPVAKSQRP